MKGPALSLVAGMALMLIVGACGSQSSPPWLLRHSLGLPSGVKAGPPDQVVWVGVGRMAVVTWGSSGCPLLPDRLDVVGGNALTVTVKADIPGMGACTTDAAPTTSVIEVPAALDLSAQVTVTIIDGIDGA